MIGVLENGHGKVNPPGDTERFILHLEKLCGDLMISDKDRKELKRLSAKLKKQRERSLNTDLKLEKICNRYWLQGEQRYTKTEIEQAIEDSLELSIVLEPGYSSFETSRRRRAYNPYDEIERVSLSVRKGKKRVAVNGNGPNSIELTICDDIEIFASIELDEMEVKELVKQMVMQL
jgi:hypothetical protein